MKNLDFNLIDGKIVTLEKGNLLFQEHEECRAIGYIIEGELKITTNSYLYNEFTIATLSNKDTFGENLLFSSSPYYLGSIYATKKTKVKLISKKNYIAFIQENLEDYLSINSNKFLILQQRTKILLQKSIREKILFFLISKANNLKTNRIPIKTKEELSNYLNIERPSLSRELKHLKEEGIIDYNKHYIEIKNSE